MLTEFLQEGVECTRVCVLACVCVCVLLFALVCVRMHA